MATEKIALVTGAARGLGYAIATALQASGVRVILADVSPTVNTAAETLGAAGAVQMDVAQYPAVETALTSINEQYGAPDILVNNAGLTTNIARTDRMKPAAWEQELAINLNGPFYLTRLVLPSMKEKGWGRIINISSTAATGGLNRQPGYAASKAGLLGLTRTVALEFAPYGITCNAVLPGLIQTEKVAELPHDILEAAIEHIPAARTGKPEEVAALVTFLASPIAGYINGVAIPIDGGASLSQVSLNRSSPSRTPQAG
ncbi:MAG: SDR family oxidoreductase [Chloroflexi bacterium]|nr:SDR family oxidoreductase [Chloroflexota bacterium]